MAENNYKKNITLNIENGHHAPHYQIIKPESCNASCIMYIIYIYILYMYISYFNNKVSEPKTLIAPLSSKDRSENMLRFHTPKSIEYMLYIFSSFYPTITQFSLKTMTAFIVVFSTYQLI